MTIFEIYKKLKDVDKDISLLQKEHLQANKLPLHIAEDIQRFEQYSQGIRTVYRTIEEDFDLPNLKP